jgi:hypothetical protein
MAHAIPVRLLRDKDMRAASAELALQPAQLAREPLRIHVVPRCPALDDLRPEVVHIHQER